MPNDKSTIADFDALFRESLLYQKSAIDHLKQASSDFSSSDYESQTLIRAHQLLLQYRLDTKNAINSLLLCNQALAQALGIEPQNDFATNLERAAFALGKDELLNELSILSHLTNELRKVLDLAEKAQMEQEKELRELKKLLAKLNNKRSIKEDALIKQDDELEESEEINLKKVKGASYHRKISKFERMLLSAIDLQVNFTHSIDQLTESLHVFGNLPQFSIIYDYLAGLKGPISRFEQALQNGMTLSSTLLNQIQTSLGLDVRKTQSNQVIHQFNQALVKTMGVQKQLLQQSHNKLQQIKNTALSLTHENQKKQNLQQKQIEADSVAKRMLNLFNRQ